MWVFVWIALGCQLVKAQDEFVPPGHEIVSTTTLGSFGAYNKCGESDSTKGRYMCVPYHKCDPETKTIFPETKNNTNGFGIIDIRFGENSCDNYLDVCCGIPSTDSTPTPSSPSPPTPETPIPTPTSPTSSSFCGIRNDNGIDFKITGDKNNEAEYGEFPWMIAILKTNYEPSLDPVLAICGGSLIAPRVILTGAHCVEQYNADAIKVRAGEWDTQTDRERLPYQERNVAKIIVHEEYQPGILYNDVALLILERPFKKAEHIGTICLPDQDEHINSRNCIATGWGKDKFGREGIYQVILKKIELPIVPRDRCESSLRGTKLGMQFNLHKSFLCAGGEEGKDTCTGDGGGPLVCPDPKNSKRYIQAGIVAWGIGCGSNVPGVYADVAQFRNWVDTHLQKLNLSNKPYTV